MNAHERDFLLACAEVVRRQQEVVPILARHLGVLPHEVFYFLMSCDRNIRSGRIPNTDWGYDGQSVSECIFGNRNGLYLRIDFGPRGRLDTFTGWGVLQFVMTSRAPWQEFRSLRSYLADKPPPYHCLSGSFKRMCEMEDRLRKSGMLEIADKDLHDFRERHTHKNIIALPESCDEQFFWDTIVSSFLTLSKRGLAEIESLQKSRRVKKSWTHLFTRS